MKERATRRVIRGLALVRWELDDYVNYQGGGVDLWSDLLVFCFGVAVASIIYPLL